MRKFLLICTASALAVLAADTPVAPVAPVAPAQAPQANFPQGSFENQQRAMRIAAGRQVARKNRLTLNSLTKLQKAHLAVYKKRHQSLLAAKYIQKEWFEPIFKLPAQYAETLRMNLIPQLELLQKELNAMPPAPNGIPTAQQAALMEKISSYRQTMEICIKIVEAYKTKKYGNMKRAVDEFQQQEFYLLGSGIALPKREWLTEDEAEPLIYASPSVPTPKKAK